MDSCPVRSRRCCAGCRRSRTWPARRRGDVELAGATIKEGQELLLLYPSANRDETVFDDADRFDITRSPNPHVAFGFGAHFCLGNQLARLELKVMFERLLARMPDIHLAADARRCPGDRPTSFRGSRPCRWRSRLPRRWATAPGARRDGRLRRRHRRLVDPRHRRRERHRARHGGAVRRRRRARHDLRAHRAEAPRRPCAHRRGGDRAAPPSAPSWRTSPSRTQVAAAVAATAEETGRIDGLFACAGGSHPPGLGAHRRHRRRCGPPSTST